MTRRVVVLGGDGVGPEVVKEACKVLDAVTGDLVFEQHLIGGVAIDALGTPLPESTLDACRAADAVLLGAVGGSKWDDPSASVRPEQGLLGLRKALGLFANLRPVKVHEALAGVSALRPELLHGVDLLIVRELCGGLYFGEPRGRQIVDGKTRAVDTLAYDEDEIARVVRLGFELASRRRGRLMSVDKANVLASSQLWREVTTELALDYPKVQLHHQLVDSAAMRLITAPASFDVIVTGNLFGDILSDEASVLAGALGMLPSASLGAGTLGLYEPVHGSAPDIAGDGVANPVGAIGSGAMLLRHSLGLEAEARAIETAVDRAIGAGARTHDLGGRLATEEMGLAILAQLP